VLVLKAVFLALDDLLSLEQGRRHAVKLAAQLADLVVAGERNLGKLELVLASEPATRDITRKPRQLAQGPQRALADPKKQKRKRNDRDQNDLKAGSQLGHPGLGARERMPKRSLI